METLLAPIFYGFCTCLVLSFLGIIFAIIFKSALIHRITETLFFSALAIIAIALLIITFYPNMQPNHNIFILWFLRISVTLGLGAAIYHIFNAWKKPINKNKIYETN